jgi:glycogen synthase
MTPERLKIAISIWTFTPNTGGLQSHAENLCKHLKQRGHEVHVITRSATRIPISGDYLFHNESREDLWVDGIAVRAIRFSKLWTPILWVILKAAARPALRALAARLYQIVSAKPAQIAFNGFDLIHHVGHATAFAGFTAAQGSKLCQIPFLVQPTAHPEFYGDSHLDFKLYDQADQLLVHSFYERDFFVSKGIKCPISVVYNGIEDRSDGREDRFRDKYKIKGPIILFLGRKSKDKGYPLTIAAFKLLKEDCPDATLVCMGPANPNEPAQLADGIIDLAYVSEMDKHDALAACSCLCVPSEGESFGLVYMEAGRYKKPCIARSLPVLRELLGKRGAALLVGRPDDQKNWVELTADELAAGMRQLLGSPALCLEIGEACYKLSGEFIWPVIVQRFESAYYSSLQPV